MAMLALDKSTLVDVGLSLVDRQRHNIEAYEIVCRDMGDEAISQSAFYRFASEFKTRYDRIRKKYRERLARLSIDQATSGQAEGMAAVLKTQLFRLMAEKVVDTDDLAQLQGRELATIVSMIDSWTRAKDRDREFVLKSAESEQRAAKAEAELALVQQRLDRLPEQVKLLRQRIDEIEGAIERGGGGGRGIDPAIFAAIRTELIAIGEANSPGLGRGPQSKVQEVTS